VSLTFVSLFSGVGGFDMGLEAAGWRCVAQVEWDKHCQGVLAHHWPDVPRWSDVSDVNGADIPAADVVAFGSPCQDLSVAGKRAGFDGKRSVLFYEATRIIREMREASNGRYPTWVVWENVAGALSSSGGRDFAAVLDELADLGAVDIAWRVLDARWFGVPQRRRRVFVVADLAGERAGTIHTEPEGVPWHPRTGRAPGQGAAAGTGGRTFDLSIRGRDGGASVEVTEELAAALRAADGGSSRGRAILHVSDESEHTHTHTHVAALTSNGVGTCGADDNQAQAGHLLLVGHVCADGSGTEPRPRGRGRPTTQPVVRDGGGA
jgi:DNA (cytosine-5)-methyltransferase 1